jgi:glycosyltransferase involved in cell wall biosynthesis
VLTIAFCTYKRADRLEKLVAALRAQSCPVPFDILAVNNNSPDKTLEVLSGLQQQPGAPLRVVTEMAQGIVPARNRAIDESRDSEIMVFLDDDELPQPGFLAAAHDGIMHEGADCVGGSVEVRFAPFPRPRWLENNLLGFLAAVDYGKTPFWVESDATPIWTCNVAYRTSLFKDGLRFDQRYNRRGAGVGGGEDVMMFQALLERGVKMLYRPDMVVEHFVEPWRLKRSYFLKLHYVSGLKTGYYKFSSCPREILGVPLFLLPQFVRQTLKTLFIYATGRPGALRQAMNMTHAMGLIAGCFTRWRGAKGP